MANVTIRDLRNHGGDTVERARRGETIVVTRGGRPVATLAPLARPPLPLSTIRANRVALPAVDPTALRADIDTLIDATL